MMWRKWMRYVSKEIVMEWGLGRMTRLQESVRECKSKHEDSQGGIDGSDSDRGGVPSIKTVKRIGKT